MDFTQYENKLPAPKYLEKPSMPYIERRPTVVQLQKYQQELKEYENKLIAYNEARTTNDEVGKKYRQESTRLQNVMIQDMYKELGILDHPKRDQVYAIAREFCDGESDDRLFYVMSELAGLLK